MSKLEVKENKKLVLKNVLRKELNNIKIDDLDNEISKFGNKLQLLHVQLFGPLIIRNRGTKIHDDGSVTMDYDLIAQAHDYLQYKDQFIIEDKHSVDNCIYVRFEGAMDEINYAYTKLDLHIYENDLISNGEIYLINVQEHPEHSIIDIFRPVSKHETL